MNKKKLIGWALCVITVFVFIISMFIAGFVEAAEKPTPKAAPKPCQGKTSAKGTTATRRHSQNH